MKALLIISLFIMAVCFATSNTSSEDEFYADAKFDEISGLLLNSAVFRTEKDFHKDLGVASKSIASILFEMLYDYAVAQLKSKLSVFTVAAASAGGKVVLDVKNTSAILASWDSSINLNATSATLLTSAAKSNISLKANGNSAIYTGVLYSSLETSAVDSKVRNVAIKSSDSLHAHSCSAFLTTISSDLTADIVDSKVGIANVTSSVDVTADKNSTIKWWIEFPSIFNAHDDYNNDTKESFEVAVTKHIKKFVHSKDKVMP